MRQAFGKACRKLRAGTFARMLKGAILSASLSVVGIAAAGAAPLSAPSLPRFSPTQQQYQQYQQRQQNLQLLSPPGANLQMRKTTPSVGASRVCVKVTSIGIAGAPHLSGSDKTRLMAKFLGRCLTLADLNGVIDTINQAYIQRGYITSRAYLPPQDLATGHLRVVVVEGRISDFRLSGARGRLAQAMAFPGQQGQVLDLHDLEQGIDQINRLPDMGATMQIAPGKTSGTSLVFVKTQQPSILHGEFWVDNNGQTSTGRDTGHAILTAEDPLGLLDLWSFEYDHSLFPWTGERHTTYISANVSIPYGDWTLFGGWWYSEDLSPLPSLSDVFHLAGTTQDLHFGASRVVTRGQVGVTTLQVSYELKSFSSRLDDTTIETQSGHLASISPTLSESLKLFGGEYYATLGLQIGLAGLGTAELFDSPGDLDPHSQYLKPSLDIDAYQPLNLGKLALFWQMALHGEFSDRNQFQINQLQIGGYYTVRGFLDQTLVGNDAGYIHNDVSWTIPPAAYSRACRAFCLDALSGAQIYAALDAGFTRAGFTSLNTPPAVKGGTIAGAGIGLRKTSGPLFWDVSLAHALAIGPLEPEGWITAFQVGGKF
jgi:hemolysin activation/secretion protein